MRKLFVIAAITLLLNACVNGFQQNYQAFVNTQAAPGLVLLAEGALPILTKSDDLKQDVSMAKSQGYIVIGEASFNGELESVDNLISQAKAVKATMVIYSSSYTDTQTISTTSYVPVDSTTVSSGRYGDKKYSEVSTTSGVVPVPTISQVRNFDQRAVFLVKSRK
ncbi:MAG: hypothetical protein K0R08_1812 [Solimicrobium sp.]|nr:hypothetical protein [Solimicrobium sp.]